jgi:hypothetical protein
MRDFMLRMGMPVTVLDLGISTPRFVRIQSQAEKYLSMAQKYPAVGVHITFLQFRPSNWQRTFWHAQGEYPAKYFFYPTIADLEVLSCHPSLIEEPVLYPATIDGEMLESLGRKGSRFGRGIEECEGSRICGSSHDSRA